MKAFLLTAYIAALHVALLLVLREAVHARREQGVLRQAALVHGIRRAEQAPAAVAVVGDSRVEDLAASLLGEAAETYGVGSQTLDDVAARLPKYRLIEARAVVLEPGINDWWSNGFDGFSGRYRRLLAAVPDGVPVVAAGLIGVDSAAAHQRWDGVNDRIKGANEAIEAACAARPHCVYAPPFAERLSPADHVGDGVHLSAAGNRRFAASLRAALAQIA